MRINTKRGFTPVVILGLASLVILVGATLYVSSQSRATPSVSPIVDSLSVPSKWKTYRNEKYGYILEYPAFLDDTAHQKFASGDLAELDSDVFKISFPPDYQKNANLQSATIFVSSKKMTGAGCFKIDDNVLVDFGEVSLKGVTFHATKVSDAGAGNFYTTYRYTTRRSGTCYIFGLTTHSLNLGVLRESNPTVVEFDSIKLVDVLKSIIGTLQFTTLAEQSVSKTAADTPSVVPIQYYNSEFGISFLYPNDWAPTEVLDDVTLLRLERAHDRIDFQVLGPFECTCTDADFEEVMINNTLFDGSGLHPKSMKNFTKVTINGRTFYKIGTGLFEGVLSYSYYLPFGNKLIKFDMSTQLGEGVDWMSPQFDGENASAHLVLKALLKSMWFSD